MLNIVTDNIAVLSTTMFARDLSYTISYKNGEFFFTETHWDRGFRSEMFLRMLTVHCDQNNSYEINGINVIFGLHYGKPSSALRSKLGCSPSWVLDDIQRFLGKPCLSNIDSWPKLIQ